MLTLLHKRLTKYFPEGAIVMGYAAVIGLGGGYAAVGFRKLIDFVSFLFYGKSQAEIVAYTYGVRTLFMPALGGLFVGLLIYYFAREVKGHGVPEVMFAVTEKKGVIRPRIVIAKALASALTIGSGGSVGREGPIVQIGSAWGSSFGQFMGIGEKYLKVLVACGAAAGIAGTFNAPLGGALFASEIILGSFALSNMGAIAISSVIATAISRIYLGNAPAFQIPHYNVNGFALLPLFLLLGALGGLFSVIYIKTLLFFELQWDRVHHLPEWVKPACGGIIVGAVGFIYPQILGVGYPSVEGALTNHLGLGLLLTLLALKLVVTSTTIASGGSGGVFAPGLFMGAMLGGAFGLICHQVVPDITVHEGVFAIIGMASLFAGTAHAPVTAMIMLFEMTNSYQLVLPLMLATVIATAISAKLNKENIYSMKLAKRGYDIRRKRHADLLSSILVSEVISADIRCFLPSISVREALQEFGSAPELIAYVREEKGQILGSITKIQLLEEVVGGRDDSLLSAIVLPPPGYIDSDSTIGEASQKMNDLGVACLMVVDCHSNPIGVIVHSDIVRVNRISS
ncbi:chloride channel protein [Paenibacillus vandeheii]